MPLFSSDVIVIGGGSPPATGGASPEAPRRPCKGSSPAWPRCTTEVGHYRTRPPLKPITLEELAAL